MAKVSLKEYLMGRDAQYPAEYTPEVKANAEDLLNRVNALLLDLGLGPTYPVYVSSGWRPSAVNAATAGAAKKSNHMLGRALDLKDGDGKLGKLFLANLHLLKKHGLYLENPEKTRGWSHLQNVAPGSGSRVFNP